MKKLLFFQWYSFMNEGIERALQKMNVEYDVFFYQFLDWEQDDVFLLKFEVFLSKTFYDKVFSINFSPLISDVCEKYGMPYISWIYDSPVHIRKKISMKNSCNTLYFFDRGEAEIYQKMGIVAKHLPLAADTVLFQERIKAEKIKRHHLISMLGKLYRTDYDYFTTPLDKYLKGYLDGILNSQLQVYGAYFIPELVTEKHLELINSCYKEVFSDGFQMERRELEFLLAQEVTGRERFMVLALLSAHFPVDLYAEEKDDRLKKVNFHGYVNYQTGMPVVFASSDINLNISLKCIRTGIPLRVIEAMGCGGFVISNYQEEIVEYLKIGEECEVYGSLEELFEKVKFYLEHDSLRRHIAERGFKCIERKFSFGERLGIMLS